MKKVKRIEQKIGEKASTLGRKSLEDGKHIGSRFWEGLIGRFPARNPCNKNKKSPIAHINQRRYNNVNVIGDNIKSERVRGGFGSRRWEGGISLKSSYLIIPLMLILLTSVFFIVSAINDDDKIALQSELDNLTSQLSSQGYSWLIDYNISYPYVSVYRENSNELLAQFPAISSGVNDSFAKYQIFLTNLGDNESYSTFDLRSVGDVSGDGCMGCYVNVRIPHDVYLMKMRIDEINKILRT